MTLVAGSDRLVAGRRIAGIDAAELAGRFGTPLFVYDLDLVAARVGALRSALPSSDALSTTTISTGDDEAVLSEVRQASIVGADRYVTVTTPIRAMGVIVIFG